MEWNSGAIQDASSRAENSAAWSTLLSLLTTMSSVIRERILAFSMSIALDQARSARAATAALSAHSPISTLSALSYIFSSSARSTISAVSMRRRIFMALLLLICVSLLVKAVVFSSRRSCMLYEPEADQIEKLKISVPASGNSSVEGPTEVDRESSLPRFAFSITGTTNDVFRIQRLLRAIYHPRNKYLIHLDSSTPQGEREELGRFLDQDVVFSTQGNVRLLPTGDRVTYRGVTMLLTYLHCASVLLEEWDTPTTSSPSRHRSAQWDWYINLSASDYPVVTQDDLIDVFSTVPRNLSFIDHSNDLRWKTQFRVLPIAVDPGLHQRRKAQLIESSAKRGSPDAFKLFTGDAWVFLSRPLVHWAIHGSDPFPRSLLLYFSNFVSSPEWYWQTLACNSEFKNHTVNSVMRYIVWDSPALQHPHTLALGHYYGMIGSGFPFARKFSDKTEEGSRLLDKVDREILQRRSLYHFAPGAWCVGDILNDLKDPCWEVGDGDTVSPGKGAERLKAAVNFFLDQKVAASTRCIDKGQ